MERPHARPQVLEQLRSRLFDGLEKQPPLFIGDFDGSPAASFDGRPAGSFPVCHL
jgi:hypothetical protein